MLSCQTILSSRFYRSLLSPHCFLSVSLLTFTILSITLVWNLLQVWAWKDEDKEMNLLVRKRNTLGMLLPLLWFLRGISAWIKALVFNSLLKGPIKCSFHKVLCGAGEMKSQVVLLLEQIVNYSSSKTTFVIFLCNGLVCASWERGSKLITYHLS